MKKTGSEQSSPAEPLERARLQADVAKQRVRIAKEELKRARKGLKEAKREARRARKHAAVARKAWKRARRAQKDDSASKENRKPGRRAKRGPAPTAAKSPAKAPARAAATATPGDLAPGAAATGARFRPGFTGIDRRAEGRGRTGCGSHSRRPGGLTDQRLPHARSARFSFELADAGEIPHGHRAAAR